MNIPPLHLNISESILIQWFFNQVVPHITDAIQDWIERVAAIPVDGEEGSADVCVIELGGTIGLSTLEHFFMGFRISSPQNNRHKHYVYVCRGY